MIYRHFINSSNAYWEDVQKLSQREVKCCDEIKRLGWVSGAGAYGVLDEMSFQMVERGAEVGVNDVLRSEERRVGKECPV